MAAEDPLAHLFSEADLETLKKGKCPRTGKVADEYVARLLTDPARADYLLPSLGQWLERAGRHGEHVRGEYESRLRSSLTKLSRFSQTIGELMAAYFLEKQLGFQLRCVPREQGVRTPDFEIRDCELTLIVEVKTVSGGLPGKPKPLCIGPLRVEPVPGGLLARRKALRQAVDKATQQVDHGKANLILIADWYRPNVFEDDVIDALRGTPELAMKVGPDGPVGGPCSIRRGDGELKWNLNTRVSAVGTLAWVGCPDCRAFFVHNAYAKRPIPYTTFDPWPQLVCNEARTGMVWRNSRDR